jgi:DnaK suppressor protein
MGIKDKKLLMLCKQALLLKKQDLLGSMQFANKEYSERDQCGDEIDQAVSAIAEAGFSAIQNKLREQLLEIESALMRIEKGTYGICEETQEEIENSRLLTLPWTRLSIEGAEYREAMRKKFN